MASTYAARRPLLARVGYLLLSWRLLRIAAPAYLLLMAGTWAVLLSLWLGGSGGRDAGGAVLGPDFPAFYTGAWLARQGEFADLYRLERQAALQQQLIPGYTGVSAYLNPPQYAVWLAPLSALPYSAAFGVWTAAMALAFAAAVLMLRSLSASPATPRSWLLDSLALCSAPVYFALSAGQNTGLTLLLHAAILVALHKRRDGLAGGLIAVGMLKPQLFVGLLPLLLLDRRWRALVACGATTSLIGGLTLATVGWETIRSWIELLRSPVYEHEVARQAAKMYSWQPFWTLALGPSAVSWALGWVSALAVFGGLSILWWRGSGDLPLRYAVTLCGLLVMGPHVFVYDLGLLLLPGLVIARRLLQEPPERWLLQRSLLLLLYVAVLFAADVALKAGLLIVPLITALGLAMLPLLQRRAGASAAV